MIATVDSSLTIACLRQEQCRSCSAVEDRHLSLQSSDMPGVSAADLRKLTREQRWQSIRIVIRRVSRDGIF